MGAQTIKLALSGYYGFGNSGDEAVLQSILLALREEGKRQGVTVEPIVLSINPEKTARTYGVRAVHRMQFGAVHAALKKCDGLISGGGSLLQDATGIKTIPYYLAILGLAQLYRKPTFIYAQGIGPVYRPIFHPFIRNLFNRCSYLSVRDDESAELLKRIGVAAERIEVVPDPVMGLPLKDSGMQHSEEVKASEEKRTPIIGISVRFWNSDRSELDALAEALRRIGSDRPVRLRFLPFHIPADIEASRYVMKQLEGLEHIGIQLIEYAVHPQDMLAEVSECDLLIGMRLHSLIYAASQHVPVVGISYDPKIDQFLNRIQMKPSASVRDFEPGRLAEETIRLLDRKAEWQDQTRASILDLKEQAARPARELISIVRQR